MWILKLLLIPVVLVGLLLQGVWYLISSIPYGVNILWCNLVHMKHHKRTNPGEYTSTVRYECIECGRKFERYYGD